MYMFEGQELLLMVFEINELQYGLISMVYIKVFSVQKLPIRFKNTDMGETECMLRVIRGIIIVLGLSFCFLLFFFFFCTLVRKL